MNANLMYEMARARTAEQQRVAQEARQARSRRAAARSRRAKPAPASEVVVPAIPDFAHEMFDMAGDAVPASRGEDARSGR